MSSHEKHHPFYPKISRYIGAAAHEALTSKHSLLSFGAGLPLAVLTVAIGVVEIPARPLFSVVAGILDKGTGMAANGIRKALSGRR